VSLAIVTTDTELEEVVAHWEVTSSDRDGVLQGEVQLPVSVEEANLSVLFKD
jgi:hypothetical protein